FDGVYRAGRAERRADEVREVLYVAEVDREGSVNRRVVDEVAAGRAAADARRVVDAAHRAQDGLALAEEVVGEAEARLEVNGLRVPEPLRRIGVRAERQAVGQTASVGDERADEV